LIVASEVHTVVLHKPSKRSLQEKVIESNLKNLLASVNTRALSVRGWTVEEGDAYPNANRDVPDNFRTAPVRAWKQEYASWAAEYEYVYKLYLRVTFESAKAPESNEFNALCNTIATRCIQPGFGKWTLSEVDDQPFEIVETGEINTDIGYAPIEGIPDDWEDNFSHLFGLDNHIMRVRRALEAGVYSNWNNRYHCALVGPPGCGKSDICQSIKRALGEDAVLEFDATATTAAGAIKELSEREILPRVLLVEEIEKADEKAMSFLLSVLDLRSQIRKTTARATIVRDTKLFAIATVNNVPLFQNLQAGALASRFSNTIWFKRPDRKQLELILKREITRLGSEGNKAWIAPTLDYCESVGISDPRSVSAICLCGRDMLLDGTYQSILAGTGEDVTQ
jgi:hypothetical protein